MTLFTFRVMGMMLFVCGLTLFLTLRDWLSQLLFLGTLSGNFWVLFGLFVGMVRAIVFGVGLLKLYLN